MNKRMRVLVCLVGIVLGACAKVENPTGPSAVVSPSPRPNASPSPNASPTADPAECVQTDLRIYALDGHSRPSPECVVRDYCDLWARPLNKYGNTLAPSCGVGQVFGWSHATSDGAICDAFGDRTSPQISYFCTLAGKLDVTATNNGFKAVASFRVVR